LTWKLARIADPGKYQALAADTFRKSGRNRASGTTTPEGIDQIDRFNNVASSLHVEKAVKRSFRAEGQP
jgi:hypothetical protein